MSNAPRFPYVGDSWSTCGTCGFLVPSRFVRLTRKWGWQCLPGNGRTRGCWDGNYDRDDIAFAYPAGEGTRETAAPLTDTLTAGTVDTNYYTYTLYDRGARALTYDVVFAETIAFGPSTSDNPAVGGITVNNGWVLYIQGGVVGPPRVDGFLYFSADFDSTVRDTAAWDGAGDIFIDTDGFLNYTPYVQQYVSGL